LLAGHASLVGTQRYIEQSPEAKRLIVASSQVHFKGTL
jgi:hypothetical protein